MSVEGMTPPDKGRSETHPTMPFTGKVCVVTGAGSGLGRALVEELARQGAILDLWDINSSGLEETSRSLAETVSSHATTVDLGAWEDVCAAAVEATRRHGHVDYLFNNAGVALFANVASGTIDEYKRVFQSNVWGVIHGTKAFLPVFMQQQSGHIINISSLFAATAVPTQSAYSASKGAVSSFTHCLAREMSGTGISVSLVIPGGLRTGLARHANIGSGVQPGEMDMRERIIRRLRGNPNKAARKILAGVAKRRRRIVAGPDAKIIDFLARMLPVFHERIMSAGLGL